LWFIKCTWYILGEDNLRDELKYREKRGMDGGQRKTYHTSVNNNFK